MSSLFWPSFVRGLKVHSRMASASKACFSSKRRCCNFSCRAAPALSAVVQRGAQQMCCPTCLILGVVKIKRFGDGVGGNRPLRIEDEHLCLPLAPLSFLAFGKLLQQGCRMRSRGL